MKHLASPNAVVAGCVLIAATNAGIVLSAASNHRTPARAELVLTERELALPEGREEDSGAIVLDLRLLHEVPGPVERTARWRRYEIAPVAYAWLDRAKLEALGFRVALDPDDPEAAAYYGRQVSRPVYLVVEDDGAAWARWLSGREAEVAEIRRRVDAGTEDRAKLADAQAVLDLDRTMRSRLVPVDAGVDAAALAEHYPSDGRHAVIEALVRPSLEKRDGGRVTLGGVLIGPVVRTIYVPRELSPQLRSFLSTERFGDLEMRERRQARDGWPAPVEPRYRATIAIGRRFEPWLKDVALGALLRFDINGGGDAKALSVASPSAVVPQ